MLVLLLAAAPAISAVERGRPSRPAEKGCTWRKLSDPKIALEAWVQRCDFGFRKIDFRFSKNSLAVEYSDGGGELDPLVDVYDLKPGESPEAGVCRLFAGRTDKATSARCVLAPYKNEFSTTPAGVERFTFVPNAAVRRLGRGSRRHPVLGGAAGERRPKDPLRAGRSGPAAL